MPASPVGTDSHDDTIIPTIGIPSIILKIDAPHYPRIDEEIYDKNNKFTPKN
jgi:hypothetical protein